MIDLVAEAFAAGVSRACLIPADQIRTRPDLAALCSPDSCHEYGLAPTCPPYVSGPPGFQRLQRRCNQALVIRQDVPEEDLLTERRVEVFRRLQDIAAALERTAVENGWPEAHAFAGGSCRRLFCSQEPDCAVLARNATCRHPAKARPSMSGFGVDLLALMTTCKWPATFLDSRQPADQANLSWVAALVLLGKGHNSRS